MKNELRVARFTLHALLCLVFISTTCAFGQVKLEEQPKNEVSVQLVTKTAEQPQVEVEESATFSEDLTAPENVTLDFKDADIHNVLKIISFKSGINIVTTPDVMGNVTMRLVDVPWDLALDVMLKTYGYGYQKQGNIILVSKLENIAKIQLEEVLQTEIFHLRFIDAYDAQKVLLPLLTKRGAVSILYSRGQKGWKYGTYQIGKERVEAAPLEKEAAGAEGVQRSKTLLITDSASSLDKIRTVILPQIDSRPKQVLIETRIMEVNRNKLRDLGVDWGLGTTGAEATTAAALKANAQTVAKNADGIAEQQLSGNSVVSQFAPTIASAFTGINGTFPYNVGAQLLFQKLTGWKFEAIVHALEEDADTNTLSAPRILTLDNQEASIMVGYHTPIFKTDVSNSSTTTGAAAATITQTLDYYQEIGIKLFVVPQVNEEGYINMIVHPSVTSSSRNQSAQIVATGVPSVSTPYPVIDVRETQTQVLLKDGETIVIGGLLKDENGKETQGIPFLENIPLLGGVFRRDTYTKRKIDLLIFITARVIKEGEYTEEELAKLRENLGKEAKEIAAMDKRKKKKKVSVKIDNTTPVKN
ncbi:MAG: secretin and TonB N-terminal domain-containing protein [Candidatus Omnitrophica bacterium]|nr:secretin and TonB N-terminal domain-containing protein [Candidatus Omnitrophota bacterium]